MAVMVCTDAYVYLNSVDLSDHVRSVTINYKAEAPESTAMGVTAKQRLGGLLDWSLDVEFNQDYANNSVDQTLFPLIGTSVSVVVRPVKGTGVGATNPNFTGTGVLTDYDPIAGKVGDVNTTKCKFTGSGLLVRAVI